MAAVLNGEGWLRGVLCVPWAFSGRSLAEAVPGWVGQHGSELQMAAPACVRVCALSCMLTLSRVPAQSCLLTWICISFTLFFHMHFVHLLFCPPCCYCNLSLSFSLCCLGCFAASYFTMALFIPLIIITLEPTYKAPRSLLCADT